MTFEELMKLDNNQERFDLLCDHVKRNQIVPFVGAGMSMFAGYPSWNQFLHTTYRKLGTRVSESTFWEYTSEEAASYLKRERGKLSFYQFDIKAAFSNNKVNSVPQNVLEKQSIFLLPFLFDDLILTTNFDAVLEKMYSSPLVGHPGHIEMLNDAFLGLEHKKLIYKFHGSIDEIEKIVLTAEDYDRVYSDGSDLMMALTKCMGQRRLLFLGCSLSQDRTMSVLKQVTEEGQYHFTIAACDPQKPEETRKHFESKRVFPILFPAGDFSCIRIFLEKLLEEKDKVVFDTLAYYESIPKTANEGTTNRFKYDSNSTAFIGRENELNHLLDFSRASLNFSWWAITGEAGMGKSRLALELRNHLENEGWHVVNMLNLRTFEEMKEKSTNLSRNTLFVVDYIQARLPEIGCWMIYIHESMHISKVRIVLIERDGSDINDTNWVKRLVERCNYPQNLLSVCHNKGAFLRLLPIRDKAKLSEIMESYAHRANKILSHADSEILLTVLEKTDPELLRPLYALFITDVYFNNSGKFPEQLSREDVLDYIVEKESDRISKIIYSFGNCPNPRLLASWMNILVFTTMTGATVFEADQFVGLSFDFDILQTESINTYHYVSAEELFSKYDLLYLDKDDDLMCPPIEPDLIGEYFVLEHFKKLRKRNQTSIINKVIEAGWQNWAEGMSSFVRRLIEDYYQLISKDFADIGLLDLLTKDYGEERINYYVSSNLVDLSFNQELGRIEATVEKLKAFMGKHPENIEFAIHYARGLVNLTYVQSLEQTETTVEELKMLTDRYPENAEFMVSYANGLSNLTYDQSPEQIETTVGKLKAFTDEYPENDEFAIHYARGLANLVEKSPEKAEVAEEKLIDFISKYPENKEFVKIYAGSLYNLICVQPLKQAEIATGKLKALTEKDTVATDTYADALGCLGYKYYAQNDRSIAAEFFYKSYSLGDGLSGVNLAYMLRRNEVSIKYQVTIEHLLEKCLQELDPFALINNSLYLTINSGAAADWLTADSFMAKLNKEQESLTEAVEWWLSLWEANDPEGLLVSTWLDRYHLLEKPHTSFIRKTRSLLKASYDVLPDWLFEKI